MSNKDKKAAATTVKKIESFGQTFKEAQASLEKARQFYNNNKKKSTEQNTLDALKFSSEAISKNEKYSEAYSLRGQIYQ